VLSRKSFMCSICMCSICAILSLLTLDSQAFAQSSSQPDELQAIYACKSIEDAGKRLACYDSSVGRFEAAEKSGEVVTVSKTAIEKVERDAFGFNIPSLPSLGKLFGGSDKAGKRKKKNALTDPVKKAPDQEVELKPTPSTPTQASLIPAKPKTSKITDVTLDIRKTTEFGYKKTRFFMTNGQVWEQTDSIDVRIPKVRNGKSNTVKISKASLGSFFLRVNGKGSAIRVRRVR